MSATEAGIAIRASGLPIGLDPESFAFSGDDISILCRRIAGFAPTTARPTRGYNRRISHRSQS